MQARIIVMVVLGVLLLGGGGYVGFLYLDRTPASAASASASAPADRAAASKAAAPASSAADDAADQPDQADEAKATIIRGTAADDVLTGTDGPDRIYAADDNDAQGKDRVDAGGGDDKIYADAGDSVQGGAGHDELVVRGAAGMTLVLAGTGIEETWGGPGNDVFDGSGVTDEPLTLRGGEGNDRLIGGSRDDVLFGGAGDDLLIGGAGDDILKGEAGTDTLTGGPGADFFNYTKFDGSTDVVTDYSFAEGDTVGGASFAVHGKDTWILDDAGNTLLVLKNYDGKAQGVARRK